MMSDAHRTALVDESFRRGSDGNGSFLMAAVVFCCPTPSQRKSEQARVRCIWNLVAELREREVQTAVFESRQEHNDRKDRREIMAAQRAALPPQTSSTDMIARKRSRSCGWRTRSWARSGSVSPAMITNWRSCWMCRCSSSAGSSPEQREGRGPVFRRGFPASLPAAQRCQHR